ncbi:MAG: hypothetical protein LBB30_02085 [Candidatus Methanoplasma sp.]|jgi:hypothetical protein|nr:hypothetical protein [Candidatus Methanoplasma sp.]
MKEKSTTYAEKKKSMKQKRRSIPFRRRKSVLFVLSAIIFAAFLGVGLLEEEI